MSVNPLISVARILEGDLSAAGWDQPNGLYAVMGPRDDPRLDLLAKGPGHPVAMLTALQQVHGSPSDDVQGLAVALEAWVHADVEVARQHPPMSELVEQGRQAGHSEGEIDNLLNGFWTRIMFSVPPSQMPAHLRAEMRAVICVLRDGTQAVVARRRGAAEVFTPSEGTFAALAIVNAMLELLNGRTPDGAP